MKSQAQTYTYIALTWASPSFLRSLFVQQAMPLELVRKPLLENVTAGNWDDGI
jgi:hypothetical protein